MASYNVAYGDKENVDIAIKRGIIPPGTIILTKNSSEILFYDLDENLTTYQEKYKFESKEEADEWTSRYDCGGQIISIHEGERCIPYIVNYDGRLTPISDVVEGRSEGSNLITIKDISSIPHDMKLNAEINKQNLITLPYDITAEEIQDIIGISTVFDEDGTIRFNGTPLEEKEFEPILVKEVLLPAGTYYFGSEYSTDPNNTATKISAKFYMNDKEVSGMVTVEEETTIQICINPILATGLGIHRVLRFWITPSKSKWIPSNPLTYYGQNILDISKRYRYVGCTLLDNNAIQANMEGYGYAGISTTYLNGLLQHLDGEDITMSFDVEYAKAKDKEEKQYYPQIVIFYTDGSQSGGGECGGKYATSYTYHLNHEGRSINYVHFRFLRSDLGNTNIDTTTIVRNIQVVIGSEDKPYLSPQVGERLPIAIGTSEYSLPSFYPMTTIIIEDSNPVNMSAEYNKDTESAIKDYAYSKEESDEKFLTRTGLGNVFAGALRGSALGTTAVTLKDVSEVEHDVQVSVATRQISICPYNNVGNTHYTDFGIDISIDRETGVLTFNGVGEGVPEDWSGMVSQLINLHKITLPAGEYEIYSGGDYRLQGCVWIGDSPTFDGTFELTEEQEIDVMLRVDITNGESFNNVTAKVFLCKVGDTPIVPLDEINVCAYGGNLLYLENAYPDNTMIGVENYNQVSQQYSKLLIPLLIALNGKTLVFSRSNHANSGMQVYIKYTNNASNTYYNNSGEDFVKFTLNIPEGESISDLYFRYAYGSVKTESDKIGKNLKLELGETPTPYTPPLKQIKVYKAGKDGTVEGVTSIYPSMTLVSDIKGVEINARYNKDINKAFEELRNAILSLGGNI